MPCINLIPGGGGAAARSEQSRRASRTNDHRWTDLANYLKEHRGHLEGMAPGAFAVARLDDLVEDGALEPGVLFCLQSSNARVQADSTYALAPYYLVYVADSGEVRLNFTQAKQVLDAFKKLSLGRAHPDAEAVAALRLIPGMAAIWGTTSTFLPGRWPQSQARPRKRAWRVSFSEEARS